MVYPSATDSRPPMTVKNNMMEWKVRLPKIGQRYRLEVDLTKLALPRFGGHRHG
jgi:hypothetical protein